MSPTGEDVDLLEYAPKDRESLVLKPNRAYGGEGVIVAPSRFGVAPVARASQQHVVNVAQDGGCAQ